MQNGGRRPGRSNRRHHVTYCVYPVVIGLTFGFCHGNSYAGEANDLQACAEVTSQKANQQFDGLTRIIDAGTMSWNCYYWRAELFMGKGQTQRAIDDLSRAIKLSNGKSTEPYVLRASAYVAAGKFDQTIADCDVVLRKDRKHAFCHLARGGALETLGRGADALAAYDEALHYRAALPYGLQETLYVRRGRMLVKTGRYAEGISSLSLADSTDIETESERRFWRGFAAIKIGQLDGARADASALLELQPRAQILFSGDHVLEMFDISTRREKRDKAIASAQAAESSKDWSAAFSAWGRAYYYLSSAMDDSNAVAPNIWDGIVRTYRQLGTKLVVPESVRQFTVQAETYFDAKEFGKAVEAYTQVLNIAPWVASAVFNRAMLRGDQLGQYESAISDMKYYIDLEPAAHDARQAQDKIYEWQAKARQ